MKFKHIFLSMLLLGSSLASLAQLCAVGYKSDKYTQFRASKTYFIKSGNAQFDNAIMAAMETSWKVTPFAVIEPGEVESRISDKSASFLSLILIGEPNRGYHYLAAFNGGKKKMKHYEYGDMVAYSPVNRWVDEPVLTDCAWRVRNMLEGMIKAIDIVQEKNISGNPLDVVNALRSYYNKRSKEIPKRTLLVSETSMGGKFKKADFLGAYPFKMEVCPRSKIEKAIADKSTDYYYLQPGITLNKSYMVVDPSNGDIVYFNYDVMGLNVNKKDVAEMVEDIQ
jgi:hypothetical protein